MRLLLLLILVATVFGSFEAMREGGGRGAAAAMTDPWGVAQSRAAAYLRQPRLQSRAGTRAQPITAVAAALLATFVTSILAYFVGYAAMLDDPGLITGTGAEPSTGIASGATLEVFLIIANVATAVVAYPVLKRESEMGAIGYVSARLVEAIFIAVGIVGALAFLLMRQDATATSTPVLGQAFVALYRRAFLIGPGFFAGLANGVILGYMMYRSGLVPRGMTWLGLIGGPLVMITGIPVMFNAIPRGGAVQGIATIPEFLWELSLSLYCIVKGFRLSSPILRMETATRPSETESALRHEA